MTTSPRSNAARRHDGPLVLAIDQGTTNSKALLAAPDRSVVASGSRRIEISFPRLGWVEQDAEQIWSATCEAVDDCLENATGRDVVGIALSTQRESALAWSARSGQALGPVLGWQDARTVEFCRELGAAHGSTVTERTGLPLDAMYSAPKMRWLRDRAIADGADPRDIRLGTIDAWLLWRLTGQFATEAGNASRTLLFDLESLGWNEELASIFGVPTSALPRVHASNGSFGLTTKDAGVPAGIPILAVMADSHAAMYAQGCIAPRRAKATYGTGTSVMAPLADTAGLRLPGLATTLAWLKDEPAYALEGNIMATGAALEWMAQLLGLAGGAELSDLASTVDEASGVSFVPAFAGLGAPHWDRDAVGTLAGLTAGTSRAHVARAGIEAVAHQVADVVEAIQLHSPDYIAALAADGAATASAVLMQAQADLLGLPVQVSDIAEASALGAALVAFSSLGVEEVSSTVEPATTYPPRMPDGERVARRRSWAAAVSRARGIDVSRPPLDEAVWERSRVTEVMT